MFYPLTNNKEKDDYFLMIAINKEEAMLLREYFPRLHVTRTMKQKSGRHHYYCEENRKAMMFLSLIKNGVCPQDAVVAAKKKKDDYNTYNYQRPANL